MLECKHTNTHIHMYTRIHTQVNSEDRRFHIVTTAQGGSVHWQIRIHYYW